MRKLFFTCFVITILSSLQSSGQEKVRPVEFEMGMGGGWAFAEGKSCGSFEMKMELRHNLENAPWDLGVYFAVGEVLEGIPYGWDKKDRLDEVVTYMLPVIHYNFRRGKRLSYFVGGGLGMYACRWNNITTGGLSVMPKAGIELFNRLRISADYKLNFQGDYQYLTLSAGFVFGGGRKKK